MFHANVHLHSRGHTHAIHDSTVPKGICGAQKASLFWQTTTVKRSPDCQWMVVVRGDKPPTVTLDHALPRHAVAVADAKGRVVGRFDFERSAEAWWIDRRTLVINDFAGSDTTRPLLFRLDTGGTAPVNLKAALTPDLVRRANLAERDLDHFYAMYRPGAGQRLRIATQFRFPGKRPETVAMRCFNYSFDRTGANMRFDGEAKCIG